MQETEATIRVSRLVRSERGRGMPQLVDLLVDIRVLLDKGVGPGDISFWLVVVVVGDEILHGVAWEKFLELGIELGGQGLIMGQHQRWPVELLNDVGDGERFAGTSDT
jgi:hypothetical protein